MARPAVNKLGVLSMASPRAPPAITLAAIWGSLDASLYYAVPNIIGYPSGCDNTMFESLSDRLGSSLRAIAGKSKLTEDNIRDTLRDVRMALLEADVALPVVKTFTDRVKDRAVGVEVSKSLTPGQSFLKIVEAELQSVMGGESEGLNLSTQPPAVVMVGLAGRG